MKTSGNARFKKIIAGSVILIVSLVMAAVSAPDDSQRRSDRPERAQRLQPSAATQPSADPNAPAASADPNASSASSKPEVSAADSKDPNAALEAVNLNNVEMKNVIQMIAEWTGKPVIPTSDEILQTKLTIYSPKKLPRSEALSLISLALQSKGVVLEILEDKIFMRPLASVRLGAVPTIGPDEPLARFEDRSQIVEKWFQLKTYSPSKLIQIIAPLTAEYGYTAADEGTSRIVVIDTVENLMRIERLIQQLDVPESAREVEKIFELQYGDPLEIVQVLELIFGQRDRRFGGGGPMQDTRPAGTRSRELPTALSVVITGTTVPIRLIPMAKQKWILARASREDMTRLEEWIRKLDIAETEDLKQTVVQVRYADVREVVRMVQSTLREMPGTELQANLVVEALPQNNQIVIYGSESNRKVVEKLIAQIDLPAEDVFIEKTFQLKHADPDKIKENITNLYETQAGSISSYSYRSGYSASRYRSVSPEDVVRVVSYPMIKQITVIASEKNLTKISQQIAEWDKPIDVETDQYRILSLQNSDPVQMADLLKKLFSEESDSSGRNLIRLLLGGDDAESRRKIVGSLYGMLTFEPVPATKKLIVISQIPEAYAVIERLVEKLDGQESAEVPRVITLKYADAEDLCDQLNAILNEAGTAATIQRSRRGLSAYSADSTQARGAAAGGNESASTITPWWTRQRPNADELPPSNLIGRVRFVPVHRSKAILALAPAEYMDDITAMIEELDQPGMQVMVKVVIMDISLSEATSLGVQLASDPSAFGTLGVNALAALNQFTAGVSRGSFAYTTSADISLLVDLLVKNANGRVLNQPTLWTKDNEEAVFVKGQKIAFIDTEQSDSSNLAATKRTFSYEDVGVTLRIRPNITPEKAVDMTINLNISQVLQELINTQVARTNLDTTTHLIVNDGQSIMLGGILEQNNNTTQQKVPLLGDLPLVGGLFRHSKAELSNSELLIFITPYVIDNRILNSIPVEGSAGTYLNESRQRLDNALEDLAEVVRRRWGQSTDPNAPIF